ncbi:MAG: sulfotransferase [Myxococcales bacterium]|nr:sulfotransferase [Myxococcales bacterium]
MPTLTLCMIVRDEARFLAGCLASVRGVVDQIVVVDTGSTDDTVAIAEAAGALVVHHAWSDDFAAARNAALPHATGDWILVLDADERLASGGAEALKEAMAAPGFVLGLLPLHDAADLDADEASVLSGERRLGQPTHLPRLLKRTKDLCWEGIVHETVAAWLVRHGSGTRFVEAAILHFGAVPEIRAERAKGARNLALLERLCDENPDAPVPFAYLASERARMEDLDGAEEAADRGWRALARSFGTHGPRPSVVSLATIRSQIQLVRGRPRDALTTVHEARSWSSEHPNFGYLAGQAHVALGEHEQAVHELRRALEGADRRWTEPVIEGAIGHGTHTLLASVFMHLGEIEEALKSWDAVLAERPDDLIAQLARIEVLVDAGRPAEALRQVEPLLAGDSADAWSLAAEATNALGDHGSALTLAARATAGRWIEPHRRRRMAELHAELSFRQGHHQPGLGPWGTLGAILARAPLPQPAIVPDDVLHAVVDTLVDRGDADGLTRLLGPRAEALRDEVPARVVARLEEHGLRFVPEEDPDFVFVGGAGRSGTTLFRAMLSAHPRLWCPPERKLVPVMAELHATWSGTMSKDLGAAGVDDAALDDAARAWLTTFLRAGAPDGVRIAEKTPHNVLHAAWLGRIFPRATFLHVIRDGRAVAESLVRQGWVDPTTGQPIAWCASLDAAARYWATVVNTAREQAASIPGRYLEVRYEDLVAKPRATMEQVLAFLDEPWDDAVLRHESSGVVHSLRESSTAAASRALDPQLAERWRERLGPRELDAIRGAAGPVLEATGYV